MLPRFRPEPENRTLLIKKAASFFFLAGMLCSFTAWRSDRSFPLAPVLDFLPGFPAPFDLVPVGALLLLLAVNCFTSKKIVNHLALLLTVLLVLQDQNRLQPWVYIYTLCLLPFSVFDKRHLNGLPLTYFQILLIGVYCWSGIHKFNPSFAEFTFQRILTDLFRLQNPDLLQTLNPGAYAIPVIEILAGLALLFPKTRQIGFWLIATTHLFILLYLSPLGINANYVVFPWNLAMIGLTYLAFFGVETPVMLFPAGNLRARLLNGPMVAFAWLLPALNLAGYWDHYLSFSLYSEKVSEFYIVVEATAVPEIDESLTAYLQVNPKLEGGQLMDVNKWAMEELNVPLYPETRVFRKVCRPFCRFNIPEGKLFFLELKRPLTDGKFNRFTCKDL